MKFLRCDHQGGHTSHGWHGTAGRLWLDQQCKSCGRIWRNLLGRRRTTPLPPWAAS